MTHYQRQIEHIQRALAPTIAAPREKLLLPHDPEGRMVRSMSPPPGVIPREAAALLLFYPADGELWLPLTARSSRLPMHRGEVSLPGGAIDPEDAGPVAAALRETHEEIGVDPAAVVLWGQLSTIYIPPSNFRLTPVVGFTPAPPVLVPNPDEIDEIFSVPLARLLDPATVVVEEWMLHGIRAMVPFFALHGYKVWGATALVLSELVARLHIVLSAEEQR